MLKHLTLCFNISHMGLYSVYKNMKQPLWEIIYSYLQIFDIGRYFHFSFNVNANTLWHFFAERGLRRHKPSTEWSGRSDRDFQVDAEVF